jgi:two-component system response regulator AlgR
LRCLDWEVCGEAADGHETIAKACDLKPDLNILDFKMPLADGLKAASEIGLKMLRIPIIMYNLYKTNKLEMAAKLAGIRGVRRQGRRCSQFAQRR